MAPHRLRLPVSTRHAFALAFDLAVRRDPVHSLVVPLLLQAPWILALGVLPDIKDSDQPWQVFAVWLAAQVGTFVVWLVISSMLRFRARSVFNTLTDTRPAPVSECYRLGIARMSWLLVTEVVRNLALVFATFFFVLPALFLSFRLSFATEAVVLSEPTLARAFGHSFKITEGRFERWLEMIVTSVVLVFSGVFVGAALSLIFQEPGLNAWVAVTQLIVVATMPVIQYAWTFFYLRLIEVEDMSQEIEVGPAYATTTTGPPAWTPAPAPATEAPPDTSKEMASGQAANHLAASTEAGELAPPHAGEPETAVAPPRDPRSTSTDDLLG